MQIRLHNASRLRIKIRRANLGNLSLGKAFIKLQPTQITPFQVRIMLI